MLLKRILVNSGVFVTLLSAGVYLLYVSLVIRPSRFTHFSLVDDGQVLIQSSDFFEKCIRTLDCSTFIDQTFEFGSLRFRPVYWMLANINFEMFGLNAENYHLFRVYVVGLCTVVLMVVLLRQAQVKWPFIFISSVIYFTSFAFNENIIRLGTNEPYQVIAVSIFSFLYLKSLSRNKRQKNYIWLTVVIMTSLLIKENNIAILGVVLLCELMLLERRILTHRLLYMVYIPIVVFLSGFFISSKLPSQITLNIPVYGSNYLTNPWIILNNIIPTLNIIVNNTTSIFKYSILISPFTFLLLKNSKKKQISPEVFYWVMCTLLFFAIQLPWKFVLDRYQLVTIFSSALLTGIILSKTYESITKLFMMNNLYRFSLDFLILIALINVFSRGFSINLARSINYSNWFAGFTHFESDQVKAIALYSENIYLNGVNNLNNWEYLYEIPIHLRYIYGIDKPVPLYHADIDPQAYILSRTSFDTVLSDEEFLSKKYQVIEKKTYNIPQIDPLKFREEFIMRPAETLTTPPFSEIGFNYSWYIYQKSKQ